MSVCVLKMRCAGHLCQGSVFADTAGGRLSRAPLGGKTPFACAGQLHPPAGYETLSTATEPPDNTLQLDFVYPVRTLSMQYLEVVGVEQDARGSVQSASSLPQSKPERSEPSASSPGIAGGGARWCVSEEHTPGCVVDVQTHRNRASVGSQILAVPNRIDRLFVVYNLFVFLFGCSRFSPRTLFGYRFFVAAPRHGWL